MNRRIPPAGIAILALLLIGIIWSSSAADLILAVAVFGTVFVLWKFPPNRWRKKETSRKSAPTSRSKAKEKRKNHPFRVIQGNKRDDDDDSDRPRMYH